MGCEHRLEWRRGQWQLEAKVCSKETLTPLDPNLEALNLTSVALSDAAEAASTCDTLV